MNVIQQMIRVQFIAQQNPEQLDRLWIVLVLSLGIFIVFLIGASDFQRKIRLSLYNPSSLLRFIPFIFIVITIYILLCSIILGVQNPTSLFTKTDYQPIDLLKILVIAIILVGIKLGEYTIPLLGKEQPVNLYTSLLNRFAGELAIVNPKIIVTLKKSIERDSGLINIPDKIIRLHQYKDKYHWDILKDKWEKLTTKKIKYVTLSLKEIEERLTHLEEELLTTLNTIAILNDS